MSQSRVAAIIVAGGSGQRMQSSVRKQYMMLKGLPVVVRTLHFFAARKFIDPILLVIPRADETFCRLELLRPHGLSERILLDYGGTHRQSSVKNGLDVLKDQGFSGKDVVLIHDGVRPFVNAAMIENCIEGARRHGACVPAIRVVDTLKRVDDHGKVVDTVSRENLYQVQTPQAFHFDLVVSAHEYALGSGLMGTDDASLVEAMGKAVYIVPGSPDNIKLTTPEDMGRAESIVSRL